MAYATTIKRITTVATPAPTTAGASAVPKFAPMVYSLKILRRNNIDARQIIRQVEMKQCWNVRLVVIVAIPIDQNSAEAWIAAMHRRTDFL